MNLLPYLPHALGIGMPQGYEWLIIGAFGLLLFGKRLPEVGRSLGKGIVEFKKGLAGIGDELEETDADKKTAFPTEQPKQIVATGDRPGDA